MAALATAPKLATCPLPVHVKATERTGVDRLRLLSPKQTKTCQAVGSHMRPVTSAALTTNHGLTRGKNPSGNERILLRQPCLRQAQGQNFQPRAAAPGSDVALPSKTAESFQVLPERDVRPESLASQGPGSQSDASVSSRESFGEVPASLRQQTESTGRSEEGQVAAGEGGIGDHRGVNGASDSTTAGTAEAQDSREAHSRDEEERETDADEDADAEKDKTGKVDEDLEFEAGFKMSRVCDRLIDVFWVERTEPDEWRKLLAYSEEWAKLRPHFYKRCKERAGQLEDLKKREELFRLGRRLKEVDDDMERHNELLRVLEAAEDIDGVVGRRRKDFTGDFFAHFQLMIEANAKNPPRREELAALGAKCVTAVNTHDKAMSDEIALENAQTKFSEILNSPDLLTACNKIDQLAAKNQLDPTLMLLITKAWVTAKESNMMKDEVRDVMFHLYKSARGNMQRLVPPEVRIMRHLITMEDPREQFAELTAAFSPGDELEGKDIDLLYTTPEKLLLWINNVLDAYYSQQEGSLMLEARRLMKPEIITKVEILKGVIQKEFM